jgi:hypothetical protein
MGGRTDRLPYDETPYTELEATSLSHRWPRSQLLPTKDSTSFRLDILLAVITHAPF